MMPENTGWPRGEAHWSDVVKLQARIKELETKLELEAETIRLNHEASKRDWAHITELEKLADDRNDVGNSLLMDKLLLQARVKELEETVSKQRDKIADFARCLEAHVQELEAAVAIYDSVYDREMSEPGDDISASLAVQLVKAEAKVKELVARVAYLEDELSQCEICDRSLLVSEVESKDLDAAVGSVKTLVCGHCWNDVNRRGGE